jgi:hypothetical protein
MKCAAVAARQRQSTQRKTIRNTLFFITASLHIGDRHAQKHDNTDHDRREYPRGYRGNDKEQLALFDLVRAKGSGSLLVRSFCGQKAEKRDQEKADRQQGNCKKQNVQNVIKEHTISSFFFPYVHFTFFRAESQEISVFSLRIPAKYDKIGVFSYI